MKSVIERIFDAAENKDLGDMQIAYLMNTYPLTSTTFIKREIEALERRGLTVKRYAVRHWSGTLVDPDDIIEKKRTEYLLTGNIAGLFVAFIAEIITNPGGFARAIGPWASLLKVSRGGFVRHVAYLMQAAYFRRQAKADGVTHVHVHFSTNASAVAMLARLMGGPGYSFTAHGPDELTDAPLLDIPAKIKHAEFVVAISHFCKSQLIRFSAVTYADKIKIVHCGIALGGFEQTAIPDNKTFVCVGRLCPQKGQAQLPEAVAALREGFPDIKLILIGDGETRGEIEAEIARHGVERNVELKGWLANDKVRASIRDGQIFLLPSFAEGLPVVIMEALALGRPVISTYIAGIPELIDDKCGWIIPAGSHEALVAAMREALLASPNDLAAKAREGRSRVEYAHDIDNEAEKLHALFEDFHT